MPSISVTPLHSVADITPCPPSLSHLCTLSMSQRCALHLCHTTAFWRCHNIVLSISATPLSVTDCRCHNVVLSISVTSLYSVAFTTLCSSYLSHHCPLSPSQRFTLYISVTPLHSLAVTATTLCPTSLLIFLTSLYSVAFKYSAGLYFIL